MSYLSEPKRILRKPVSQQEYNLLEEWAPQKLNEYRNTENDAPAPDITQQYRTRRAQSSKSVREGGYTAPNGTHLCQDELAKLSGGIEDSELQCKVYFRPCFIEDPWKDLKFVKMEFTFRYWGPDKLQHYRVTSTRTEELKLPAQLPERCTSPRVAQGRRYPRALKSNRPSAGIGCGRLHADPQKRQENQTKTEGGAEGRRARRPLAGVSIGGMVEDRRLGAESYRGDSTQY
ncbi:hypothetical protein BDV28DRAFT_152641 [Aspergillus coremiiformis]|uniref:Uncharacterized protein n=1 Tax=Aspergillus coremiiformis TaxID=138285 RepID=A0A5N6YU70_9EURO|nr:hypothetical protein BDV28DRAFT_152641 [Aspergillus coremiiformis]